MMTQDQNVFSVSHWRKEFERLKPALPTDWRKKIAQMDDFYGTYDGYNAIRSVVEGRASIERTSRLVQLLEIMVRKIRTTRTMAGKSAVERFNALK